MARYDYGPGKAGIRVPPGKLSAFKTLVQKAHGNHDIQVRTLAIVAGTIMSMSIIGTGAYYKVENT